MPIVQGCEGSDVAGFSCPHQSQFPVFEVGKEFTYQLLCSFHSRCKLQKDFELSKISLKKDEVEE